MCVIITSPQRAQRPTLEQLTLCETANPHGSGIAWLIGKRVQYVKGLTVAEIHRQLRRIDGPAIVHFRIASVGGVDPALCHPFPVTHHASLRSSGSARAVLFHNGTWNHYARAAEQYGIEFPKREPVSDTRVAASLVARFGFDWLQSAGIDYGNRWAMLNARGIRRFGEWHSWRGCHFSNTYWRPPTQRDFGYGGDWWKSGGKGGRS
jgi:predicted glutamine amidotransferase